jgi:hypothetical protein
MGDIITIYEEVLSKGNRRLPNGFWREEFGKERFKEILRYQVLSKMKWDKKQFFMEATYDLFFEWLLVRPVNHLFANIQDALNYTFPEWKVTAQRISYSELKYWESKGIPVTKHRKKDYYYGSHAK